MKTLDEHNEIAMRKFQDFNKPHKNGIACPECGEELYDSSPNIVLTSYPPQYHIHCEKCGYKGTRY